ncbi:MAG: type II toxin-antitoxin system VapC family toxin [Candidatus Tectomicrobia bacterium]|nr:type II toxin-antitoxin system VapC family toxin [Candidatus Tectomicrobia bacterium]
MRAIDTNVVIRYLIGDDPEQAARARTTVDAGEVFVSTTVLLESEWVLRSVYGFLADEVAAALRAFSGLPGVSVENPALLLEALDLTERGMDFADALHLGAAASCEVMLTFDRRFVETASNAAIQVTEP